jgi:hypothetical protein
MLLSLACAPNPCWNGGTCVPISGSWDYYCICPPSLPLTGKNCDQMLSTTIAWSPCSSNPCMNSGVCTGNQLSNTFTCTCSNYYYGNRCECMYSDHLYSCKEFLLLSRYEPVLYAVTLSKWWYMSSRTRQYNYMSMSSSLYRNILRTKHDSTKYDSWSIYANNLIKQFTFLDICASMPCRNNATCLSLNNQQQYYCHCAPGFSGPTCSKKRLLFLIY